MSPYHVGASVIGQRWSTNMGIFIERVYLSFSQERYHVFWYISEEQELILLRGQLFYIQETIFGEIFVNMGSVYIRELYLPGDNIMKNIS